VNTTGGDARTQSLLAELDVLRRLLRGEPAAAPEPAPATQGDPGALDQVTDGFGLTGFERSVLLLTAGPELAGDVAAELVAASGAPHPTFGLALRLLPGAHWSALTPAAPLRRWQLVRLLDPTSPTRSPLAVDERVLHHLLDVGYLDAEVAALARPAEPLQVPAPSLVDAAARVATAWEAGRGVVLHGPQPANLAPVAAAAAKALGRSLLVLATGDLPTQPEDRERLLRLLERESVLTGAAWAFDVGDEPAPWVARAVATVDAPAVALGGRVAPGVVTVAVPRLPPAERESVLAACVARHPGSPASPEEIHAAAEAFDLPVADLDAAADALPGRSLWDACRERARRGFGGLARVVEPHHVWDDLVLPPGQLAQLHGLVDSARHRTTVNETWGFAAGNGRGLGTAALFAGPSGTGKTLAAEVVAGELGLDLLVIDLSQVVSKYIGETEKHLARLFDTAEDSGAVLLFDEADTLFGRRTEVRDSHDRYANLEVGYLLQRVESFRGLAILTTNARNALDPAFLRRLRVVISFPYPDVTARTELWRRAFPSSTPTADLDPVALATVDLPGGGIAAAALTAAYLGVDRGLVTAEDVAVATRWELAKHGRTSTSR
jgi:ATPase family associated with various cellular activities (AAA)